MQKVITSLLIFLLSLNILYVFSGVLFHPLESQDAFGIWMLKAKAIFVEKGFPTSYLHNELYGYSHQTYPLAVPFMISSLYFLQGKVDELLPSLLYPVLYVSILVLVFTYFKKRNVSTHASLFFTYMFSMLSPLLASGGRILFGGADIFLVLIGWILVHVLNKEEIKRKEIVLSLILIMISSQIKFEGVFLSFLFLLLPLKKFQKIFLFILSIVPTLVWLVLMNTLHVKSDITFAFPEGMMLIHRVFVVLLQISKEFVNIKNWYIFWLLFFISLFMPGKISKHLKSVFLPLFVLILCFQICVYTFSNIDVVSYVSSSIDRILLQLSFIPFIYLSEKIMSNAFFKKIDKKVDG